MIRGMGKRRKYVLLVVIVLVAVGLGVAFIPSREPSYGGKRLSEWVANDHISVAEREDAVRHIGTKAIPYLMEWIRDEPSTLKTKCTELVGQFLQFLRITRHRSLHDPRGAMGFGAAQLLQVLRPQADAFLPDLVQLMNDANADGSGRAIAAVAGFGKEGLPFLMESLTNGPGTWHVFLIHKISTMGTNAQPAVVLLQRLARESNGSDRFFLTNALYKIDPQALQDALQ